MGRGACIAAYTSVSKIHQFHASLKKGKDAESRFLKKFEGRVEQLDGYKGDFKIISSGKIIELKVDFYDPNLTPNFFMERYSYDAKPGGAWQAMENGASYYVYVFAQEPDKIYVFEVEKLIAEMEKLMPKLRCINVKNVGHTTIGFLTPRELLTHLTLNIEEIL